MKRALTLREKVLATLSGPALRFGSSFPWIFGKPQAVTAVSIYCVYRARNSAVVAAYSKGLQAPDRVYLHRLDDGSDPDLPHTVSRGAGQRMQLLQHLIDSHPPSSGSSVIIVDDDVAGAPGWIRRFAGFALKGGIDVAQPTHSRSSHHSFSFNRTRALSIARLTKSVEIGPAFCIAPRAQNVLLPFPADAGMGWGLDAAWSQTRNQGIRFGVIDAVSVTHLGEVASAYPVTAETDRLEKVLAELPDDDGHPWQADLSAPWRPWSPRPPWESTDLLHPERPARPHA